MIARMSLVPPGGLVAMAPEALLWWSRDAGPSGSPCRNERALIDPQFITCAAATTTTTTAVEIMTPRARTPGWSSWGSARSGPGGSPVWFPREPRVETQEELSLSGKYVEVKVT
ncbi:unnamed protein product [Merluccius merluccius]